MRVKKKKSSASAGGGKTVGKRAAGTAKRDRKPAPRAKTGGSKPAQKKKSKKAAGKNAAILKRGMRRALYDFYTISLVFLMLLVLSSMFLLFQWKNYKVVEFGKEIQRLQSEKLRLESEMSRNQAKMITFQQKVEKIAPEKLGLKPAIREPVLFRIDQKKLDYYVQKDREAQKE